MRKLLIVALIAIAAMLALRYTSAKPQRAWTTDSPAALEEFKKALEARMKFYHMDAAEHCRRALELDPDFAAAKVFRLNYSHGQRAEKIAESLREVDLDRLTPREAFMVSYALAELDEGPDGRRALAKAYVLEHPKDPYGIMYLCDTQVDPKEQEACFRKLIAIEPNFVLAQNVLGYLAMAQGHFEEAEERFRTYQYIAPGQANPHDSMGELLVLLGRYEEARQELEAALALRPDFQASYTSLVNAALLQEQVEEAQAAVRRGENAGMGRDWLQGMGCEILLRQLSLNADWETVYQATDACRMTYRTTLPMFMRHRAALATARMDEARRIEENASRLAAEQQGKPHFGSLLWAATDEHLRAVRMSFEGRREKALEGFERADEALAYSGFEAGSLKLQNRLALAQTLRQGGQVPEAEALEDAVRRINPDFLRDAVRFSSPQLTLAAAP